MTSGSGRTARSPSSRGASPSNRTRARVILGSLIVHTPSMLDRLEGWPMAVDAPHDWIYVMIERAMLVAKQPTRVVLHRKMLHWQFYSVKAS